MKSGNKIKMASLVRTFVSSFGKKINTTVSNARIVINFWTSKGPPPAFAIAGCPSVYPPSAKEDESSAQLTLESIFDGVLLAVPKFRRSLEKRLHRKHRFTSFMEHGTPKKNIVPCLECGHFKEKGHLCQNCYEQVRQETKEMQSKMGDDLEFNIPRTETEVIYQGEKSESDKSYVIDMNKPRPTWFPRRLLNRTGS